MKKVMYFGVALLVALTTVNCSGVKKVVKEKEAGTEEIILPLSGKEYQSDKENYRAKSSGKSPDIATAKKIALNNAKSEIAGLISSKIKAVTENYTNQRSVANAQDFENKFENLTKEVVSQQLVDVSVIGEKLLKTGTTYEYWIALEVSKQAILNGISNSISKNQKLQIDYDKKKFEENYNQEMDKMDKQ
ncbi:hypothetical protein [uncultured Bacteroides sp.]|uniref:hypothetical protein n=1 Tax=uncultured Bacteroides sp. TaxID=162156 RepID=UPI002AAB55E5|nr:hypothetical protein [uncultured Bacteroides sp.]